MARSSSCSPPAASLFYNNDGGVIEYCEPRHSFLEFCFLCRKSLAGSRDIFMYRGDTAFCSEECRQEQIEMDEEAQEKKRWKQSLVKTSGKKKKKSAESQKIHVAAVVG